MVDLTEDVSEDLSELRSLLLAPEQTQLDRLQERLDNPVLRTHEVSRLLPGALTLIKDEPSLTATLTPHVEQAFFTSLRRLPKPSSMPLPPSWDRPFAKLSDRPYNP
jgi:OOP family OmpA-OmpF porin